MSDLSVSSDNPIVLSKSARKKMAKKAYQMAKKQAASEIKTKGIIETHINEDKLDEDAFKSHRIMMLTKYQADSTKWYPNGWKNTTTLRELISHYGDQAITGLANGEHMDSKYQVHVAGRIESIRVASKKLYFCHIWSETFDYRIQILANLMYYDDTDEFQQLLPILRRGDIIGIIGVPAYSKRGELSIIPSKVVLLAPSLKPLPPPQAKLKSIDVRFRQRYLDLQINPLTREIFQTRAKIIQSLRDFLNIRGFLEVETPMMNQIPGGATAKPFITHHNSMDQNLYLRIAPELYLKKLVIGGLEKVYEIGKNFRNEGCDTTHNPEFTSCEFYQAYADADSLMNLTEELIRELVKKVTNGAQKINFNSPNLNDVLEIDFSQPFRRVSMMTTLREKLPNTFGELPEQEFTQLKWDSKLANQLLCQSIDQLGLKCAIRTSAKMIDKLVGHLIEPECQQPTFITDHPKIMSPLAKARTDQPELTERFELFVAGWEIANAYTELNNPMIQNDRFTQQSADKANGDDEAQFPDQSFVTALEYALPPTGGWGMGVDRLVMLLTNQQSIREVLLFPLMKEK